MGRRRPFKVHHIDDESGLAAGCTIAAIAYDGDPDVFVALAWAVCLDLGEEWPIQPPRYTRFRCEPDPCGEHAWHLTDRPDGGRGTWAGARVVIRTNAGGIR